jgi:hypothetical protein
VQIDDLSHTVLEKALAQGQVPVLARLLRRGFRLAPTCAGLPSSTPAFQLAAIDAVRLAIPGFQDSA